MARRALAVVARVASIAMVAMVAMAALLAWVASASNAAVPTAGSFAEPAGANGKEVIAQAIDARDARHDPKAARALLAPLAEGPRDTADQRDIAARAHFLLGDLDERDRLYASAVTHYRAVLAIDAGNWFASTAQARLQALQEYDVDFAWLARLDAVRKDPARSSDPASIESLEREADSFPIGRSRTEALLFIAEAWGGRLHDPARAIAPALRVARDPSADPVARATGFELAYSALHAIGDLDGAVREIASDPNAPVAIVTRIRRDLRRRTLHRAARGSLGFGAAMSLFGLEESIRRRRLHVMLAALRNPYALIFLATACLGGFALAEAWERGAGPPFVALAGVLALVHLLVSAVRGGFGDRALSLRIACGLAAASCVLAAAYLVLEHGETVGRPMLEGFGL